MANQTDEMPKPQDVAQGDSGEVIKAMLLNIQNTMTSMNSRIESIQHENKEWRNRFEALEKECGDVKDSVEMAHNLIRDETAKREKSIKSLKDAIDRHTVEQAANLKVINSHSGQLKTLNNSVKVITGRLDSAVEDHRNLVKPIESLKVKMEGVLGEVNFPVNTTVVGQNVWYRPNKDLNKVVELIINKTLNLPEVKIVRVERKTGFESNAGLIKMGLETEGDVHRVLKEKQKLRAAPAKELREVFLRQSKSRETLLAERNQDTILHEIGVRDEYVRLSTGHLARKDNRYGRPGSNCGR